MSEKISYKNIKVIFIVGILVIFLLAVGAGIGFKLINGKKNNTTDSKSIPRIENLNSVKISKNNRVDIKGKYLSTGIHKGVELDINNESDENIAGKIYTGSPGCGGSVNLIGKYNIKNNILTVRNPNAHHLGICRMIFKFNPKPKSFQELHEGIKCAQYHGASCGFGFYYHLSLEKSNPNQPEQKIPTTSSQENGNDSKSNLPFNISEQIYKTKFGDVWVKTKYLRIVSLTRQLTVLGIIINDGYCHVQLKKINFAACYGNGSCKPSIPLLPLTLKYGMHQDFLIHCTAYKVELKTNKGEYTENQK